MITIDRNLNKIEAFTPESMSLNLEERKSTASMTLGPTAPPLTVGDWLLDDREPGAGIIWRIKTIDTQYNTNTRTVQLEHIISTLKDIIMFGEVTAADMSGTSGATTCSAWQAARYALSYQSTWVLDGFDYSVSNPYSFNGDTVFAALETISSSLEDCYWSYDLTRVPFRLSIRRLSSNVASEMRMDRNIQTLKRTVDRSRLYTRFYPIGYNDLHISGDYVSKNENLYGTVCAVETDQSKKTDAELYQWAWERLNRHCEPSVTIQISGLDLSEATGEPLDHFTLNTKCRVPLPEFNTTIIEKVTKLSWSDKLKEPSKVTITLANLLEDVASIISNANSASKKSGRTKAKDDKDKHAWFVETNDHVGLVAEAVAGPGADKDWSRVSSIFVDGEGIHQKVVRTENDLVVAQTAIEANEYRIKLEAQRAITKEAELSAGITVQADRITSEVEARVRGEVTINSKITQTAQMIQQEVTDRRNADNTLSGRITVEAGKITQIVQSVGKDGKVTAASICLAINNGGSTATINADKIYLLGQTIANQITADYISTKIASMSQLVCNGLNVIGSCYVRNGGGNQQNVSGAIWDLDLSLSGNTYTLKRKRIQDSDWVTVGTFSRATTLSGAWSSGKFTVSASPQGDTFWTDLVQGSTTWNGNTGTIPINAIDADSGGNTVSTGRSVSVDATSRYNAGVDYAKPVSWTAGSEGTQSQFTAKATSTGGGSATKTYYLTKNGSYIEVHEGSQTGTMVARRSTS